MTTNVKVHVNGRYVATVTQGVREPVEVHGNYDGSPNPSGERSFTLGHPASETFEISERAVPEPSLEDGAADSTGASDQ